MQFAVAFNSDDSDGDGDGDGGGTCGGGILIIAQLTL
jgi:hypothetical protein